MMLRTVQWNIGGGKIRRQDEDQTEQSSYAHDGLETIIATLAKYKPDIVTLQECHSDAVSNQVEGIAHTLGLSYWASDVYDESHLEAGKKLTQGIISKFPFSSHRFEYFFNPKFETIGPRDEKWISHDKGVTGLVLNIDGTSVEVKTSHSIPFRRFHVDPLSEGCSVLRNDMEQKLFPTGEKFLFQGDINYDEASVRGFFPHLIVSGVCEVVLDTPTTPKARWYDHVMYRGIAHRKSFVDGDVLTDHYPVISEFEI